MTTVGGRLVTCPTCHDVVRRYELPHGPIGNDVCGSCLVPVNAIHAQRPILTGEPRHKSLRRRSYDPETAPWPVGF